MASLCGGRTVHSTSASSSVDVLPVSVCLSLVPENQSRYSHGCVKLPQCLFQKNEMHWVSSNVTEHCLFPSKLGVFSFFLTSFPPDIRGIQSHSWLNCGVSVLVIYGGII
jgi:hypothetical protein